MARFNVGSLELITCFIARFTADLEIPFQNFLIAFYDVKLVLQNCFNSLLFRRNLAKSISLSLTFVTFIILGVLPENVSDSFSSSTKDSLLRFCWLSVSSGEVSFKSFNSLPTSALSKWDFRRLTRPRKFAAC